MHETRSKSQRIERDVSERSRTYRVGERIGRWFLGPLSFVVCVAVAGVAIWLLYLAAEWTIEIALGGIASLFE